MHIYVPSKIGFFVRVFLYSFELSVDFNISESMHHRAKQRLFELGTLDKHVYEVFLVKKNFFFADSSLPVYMPNGTF